jgi:hypothetical protein
VQEFDDNKFLGASEDRINFWSVTTSLPEAAGMKHAAESSLEGNMQKKRKMNPPEVTPDPAAPAIEQPEATAPIDDDFEELLLEFRKELLAEAAELEEQVRRVNKANAPAAPAIEQPPAGRKRATESSLEGNMLKKRKANPPEVAPAPVQVVGAPNIAEADAFEEEPQFDAGEFVGEEDDDSSNDEVQATRPGSNRGSRMLKVCLIWHYQLLLIKRYLTNTFPSNNSN